MIFLLINKNNIIILYPYPECIHFEFHLIRFYQHLYHLNQTLNYRKYIRHLFQRYLIVSILFIEPIISSSALSSIFFLVFYLNCKNLIQLFLNIQLKKRFEI